MSSSNVNPDAVFDIAVVGGGVAGAYAAYRLSTAEAGNCPKLNALRRGRSPLRLTLLEESDRIGGRLWSHTDSRFPDMIMELGGQGFSELQQNVYGLCTRELRSELSVESCPAFCLGTQLQYQRGHRFPYQAYSPLPPDPSTLAELPGSARAARLSAYRKSIARLCPTAPPLPGNLAQIGLATITAWCTAAKAAIQNTTRYYPDIVPYFLRDSEKWTDPFQLLMNVVLAFSTDLRDGFEAVSKEISAHGASATAFSQLNALQTLLRSTPGPGGELLPAHGFWNICAAQLSAEAYGMAGSASFASSSIGNWNLYDSALAMMWGALFYQLETPFYSVKEGYDRLPATLLQRFQASGGEVITGRRLLAVDLDDCNGERLVRLTVCPRDNPEARSEMCARYVILALPKRALELIHINAGDPANPAFLADVGSVEPVRASKVFMVYPRPWWKETVEADIEGGYSTTDLPVRACYYMQTAPNGVSLVLTSLNDEEADTFWAGYEREPRAVLAAIRDLPPLSLPKISAEGMGQEIQRQLAEMHGVTPPDPLTGPVYFNWAVDPFGGGWHNWRPGLKSWEVMPRVRTLSRQEADPRIFLCGEAWSNQQGWVEGALNSAEMVLETYFGLPRPDWVASTYELGP